MEARVAIDAGICGFRTEACATSRDERLVTLGIDSNCEKITRLGQVLQQAGPIDAYREISPTGKSVMLETARNVLQGCCAGCAVPIGLFKCMQVAAGLALPKEIRIELSKPEC